MSTEQQNADLYNRIFGDTHALELAIHQDPRYLQAVRSGTPTRFRIVVPGARNDTRMNNSDGGWDVRVDAGGKVSASNGGIWKPLAMAGAVATGGTVAGQLLGPSLPTSVNASGDIPMTTYGNGMAATAPSVASNAPVLASSLPAVANATTRAGVPSLAKKAAEIGLNAIPAVAQAVSGNQNPADSHELNALLVQQQQRLAKSQPLREMVMRQSLNRLPISAKAGLSIPSYADVNKSLPPLSGGNFAQSDALRNLLREQQVTNQMGQPMYDAILRLAQSRMPGGM